jgi:hypothetical protein
MERQQGLCVADDIVEATRVKAALEKGVIGNGYVRIAQPRPPRNSSASQKHD